MTSATMMTSSKRTSINGLTLASCWCIVFLEVFQTTLSKASGLPLHFMVEIPPLFLDQGSTIALDCAAGPGNTDIRWISNGSSIAPGNHEVKGIYSSRLTLVPGRNMEIVQCIANNSDGAVRSLPTFVSNAYLSDFGEGLVDRTIEAIAKNTAVIPCATPKGSPPTITEFEINSNLLLLTARHLILPSGNLQISTVTAEDSGDYRCIAVNPVTGDRRSAPTVVTLKVTESTSMIEPRFTWTPQPHLEVIRGQNLTLECAAEGWPVPRLSWKRYGGVLPEGRSTTKWGNLLISGVHKSDEGTYICRAEAEVNSTDLKDNVVAFIDVLEPPTVTLSPSDQNVTQFDSVTLTCNATGSPKISITWYHNALPVVKSPQVIASVNGSLTLRSVQRHHSGMYQCFAENSVGVAYASARLTVGLGETSVDSDPEFRIYDEMQNVAPSGPRQTRQKKLPKSSSGRPRPTSALVVGTETADSSKEESDEEADIPATLLPPSKPVVTKSTDTSVLLGWTVTQNGSLPVVFFKVQYKEIVDGKKSRWKTVDEEIPLRSRSYEVLSLKSGATYQFRIAAVYSNHDNKNGPVSDRFVLKTGSSVSGRSRALVSVPMIVDIRANISSFLVVWQYQPTERVPVEGFKISYRPYGSDVDYQSVKVTGPGIRRATITDLKPDTAYSIHMSCFNADGESNSSISVFRKTIGLFESSATPLDEKGFLDPTDNRQTTTTTAVRAYYSTNRINTYASNELLFIVLGVVLGVMMLVLCVVMVTCAFKQRQQRRLMAALDGRRKFHDPSKTIYIGSHMKSPAEGSFLLNGVGTAPRKSTTNGYLSVRGNGVAPGNNQPTSEYELDCATKGETEEEEIPLREGQNSCEYDDCSGVRSPYSQPLNDKEQTGYNPIVDRLSSGTGQLPEPTGRGAVIYRPPEDLPTISRPRDVPLQQLSLKSSRSSCDYRLHGNDGSESYPSVQASSSPDHIPRLHECQLLYRSPEHTRRSRDRSRGRHEQVSDRSLSASSQVSGSHLRSGKCSNQANIELEPIVDGRSKITNILPVDPHSSDADSHPEDGANVVNSFAGSTEDSAVPVPSRVSQSDPSNQTQPECKNTGDCSETVDYDPVSSDKIHCNS